MKYIVIVLLACVALLSGCATTTEGGYTVGPRGGAEDIATGSPLEITTQQLSVLVPVFLPNIPKNTDDYAKEGVWPELRRAESNRFAVQLRNAISSKDIFGAVRVSPNDSATAHLYVQGKILESTGEDISLLILVTDISGKRVMKKTYKHRVSEYVFEDPRNKGVDVYQPIFDKVANDLVKFSKRINSKHISKISGIEEMRFAESFSPEYFSKYLSTSSKSRGVHELSKKRSSRTKLLGFPADTDPMLQRVRSLRVKDQMFIDNIQIDYDDFKIAMNEHYTVWQKQSFYESKAAREAQAEASAQMLVGILAVAAGAALASDSNSSAGYYSGVAIAAAGVGTIADGFQTSKDSKAHRESLNEMGRSLNIQLAPNVIEMEDRTIELTGTASEQYTSWRKYLREIYLSEQTPETIL